MAKRNPIIQIGKYEKEITKENVQQDSDFWKHFHDQMVEERRRAINSYDSDSGNEKRLEDQLCKYCYYMGKGFAGMAITTVKCNKCGIEMTFPSTSTDKYCKDCAKELNVCKHCGAKMD